MIVFYFFLLVLVSLSGNATQATYLDVEYPHILNFYPSCQYEVIKNYSVKEKIDDLLEKEEITNDLLLKIRKKAGDLGADAVILKAKDIKRTVTSTKIKRAVFTLKYDAELIKLCSEDSHKVQKLTPYNHLGDKVISSATSSIKTTTYSYTVNFSSDIHRPVLTNKEVSLDSGVYGVELGENYKSVITALGTPNTILNVFIDELVIGYGRRHWLYFQNDKLVKLQTTPPLLSISMLNQVPFLDFFDDFQWKINNKAANQSSWADVKAALKTTKNLNEEHQLVLENRKAKLTLLFSKYIEQSEQDENYVLSGFSLEKSSYKLRDNRVAVDKEKQFNLLENIIDSLNKNKNLNLKTVKSQLGDPLGIISISKYEQLFVYNDHLFLQIKNDDIESINLVEEIFKPGVFENTPTPWSIGSFKQGASIEQLRQNFPSDSFELDNTVEIDTDKYQLTLMFDEVEDDILLYEVNLRLY